GCESGSHCWPPPEAPGRAPLADAPATPTVFRRIPRCGEGSDSERSKESPRSALCRRRVPARDPARALPRRRACSESAEREHRTPLRRSPLRASADSAAPSSVSTLVQRLLVGAAGGFPRAASAAVTPSQKYDPIGSHLRGDVLIAARIGPHARLEAAFDENGLALAQMFRGPRTQRRPRHDLVPFGLPLSLTAPLRYQLVRRD